MSDGSPTRKTDRKTYQDRLDRLSMRLTAEEENIGLHSATPDAQADKPRKSGGRMKARPRVRRRSGGALGFEVRRSFARALFHIPIGTLRDWEQGRAEPDQARACLS